MRRRRWSIEAEAEPNEPLAELGVAPGESSASNAAQKAENVTQNTQ